MMVKNKPIKFIIISPYEEIHSCGVRSLSSYLKSKGIQVSTVFCWIQSRYDAFIFHRQRNTLPDSVINDIARIAADATCIGISLMTDYFNAAVFLTKELKKLLPHIPILWGGIHPTISPQQCADYADFVCVGEGYESTYELLQCLEAGNKFPSVAGIHYKRDGEFVTNDARPLVSDVDLLPFMDYGLEAHYIRRRDSIVPMTSSFLNRHLGFWYTSFFTHGCPFSCSYCCNSFLHKFNPGYAKIRKHTPEYIIEEMKSIRKMHPFIKMVKFNDDCFLSLTESEMERFAALQEKSGKMPFVATGINPNLVTEQKIDILIKAGLRRVRIGIQSGSERILTQVYNRKMEMENVIRSSEILSRYTRQLVPTAYDIILDNPWERPQDLVDTFNLICQLRRPLILNIFSLSLYPNTALWQKAFKEGVKGVESLTGYSRNFLGWSNNYLNCLIALEGIVPVPYFLRRQLLSDKIVKKNPRVPKLLRNFFYGLGLGKRVYAHTSRRDITMLPYFLARWLM